MLSTISNDDQDKKLIINRDSFPIQVEADNPFVASAALGFDTVSRKRLESSPPEFEKYSLGSESIEGLKMKQIETAKIRLNRMPTNVQLVNNLGLSYLNHGEITKAIECFERALTLNPTSFTTCGNLAKAYLSKGDVDKALGIYLQIEKREPDNIRVLNNLSNLLIQRNDFARARQYLERVVKQDNKNIAGLSNLAMIELVEGKTHKAIHLLRQALALDPNLPGVLNNIGVCFVVEKSFVKAIKHFLAAHALNKRDVGILLNLANTYLSKGSIEKATHLLEDRLSDGEDNPQVREMLAWMYISNKAYKKALKQLVELLGLLRASSHEKEADKARVLNGLGVVYQAMDNFELPSVPI